MKSTHTGDIHWGMCPDANKLWGKERAQVIRDTSRVIVEKIKEMDVDCLFISKDLFHRQPSMKDLRGVSYLFSTIPSARTTLIVGSRDRIREDSALLSFIWSPSMTFIMDEDLTSVYFEDINTKIHGFSCHTAEIKAPLPGDIQVPLNSRTRIFMAHGGNAAHLPINFNSPELSSFSYVALGHIHKHHVLADGKIAYRGSPEPLDLTETGSYGFYAGEVHPVTRELTGLQLIPAASLQYIPLAVNVSKDAINGELCGRVSDGIENRDSQHIYRLRIRGMRDPDIEFGLEQLSAGHRIAGIIDDSEPQYDFPTLSAEHFSNMIGLYIQVLQKEDMNPVEKKALYYGVNALLHTTDEGS